MAQQIDLSKPEVRLNLMQSLQFQDQNPNKLKISQSKSLNSHVNLKQYIKAILESTPKTIKVQNGILIGDQD